MTTIHTTVGRWFIVLLATSLPPGKEMAGGTAHTQLTMRHANQPSSRNRAPSSLADTVCRYNLSTSLHRGTTAVS